MARDLDRQRRFSRRALILGAGETLLIGILAGRLYQLQVIERERFTTLADDNRINLRLLAPPRGRILDRNGRLLAGNRQDFRAVIVAEVAGDVDATLRALEQVIPLGESDRRRVLRDVSRHRRFVPVTVRDDLSWEEVASVEVNALNLPGIEIEEGLSREYPYGELLSHVLGYVAPVSDTDDTKDPLLELPGFRIGKAGIERTYELQLRGVGGSSRVEVNAVGRVVRELDRHEGEPGIDIPLSIDLEIQKRATDLLAEQSGAVVLLDIHTGEVLAMVSVPGYDPSAFNRGLTVEEWRNLTHNPKAPLTNKAIAGQYAPGSTFKPVVALAALEKGVMTPSTTVFCSGAVQIGNTSFHCWRRGGHGTLAMRDALAQSCDCYFYEAARRIGVDRITAMGRRLGLGHPLGIDLPHERQGLLPSREWKAATTGGVWSTGETVVTGIGQGYVLATPLQLAVMSARIANGQQAIVPHLIRDHPGNSQLPSLPIPAPLDINADHLRVVRDGMNWVVNSPHGTAKSSAIHAAGMEMAGKTGTSQVRRISRSERLSGVIKNENLPWEKRDHALFVGYAPVSNPRYAVAVIVEHGGGGSKAAAPVAKDVLLAVQQMAAARSAAEGPKHDPKQAFRSG